MLAIAGERAVIGIVVSVLAGCAPSLTSEEAQALIGRYFPLSQAGVEDIREAGDGYVVLAAVGGHDGRFEVHRYDTGWQIDAAATTDGGPESLVAWQRDWGDTLLEPFAMGTGDRQPTELLASYASQIVQIGPAEIQIRLDDQVLVIEGDYLDQTPVKVGDSVVITAMSFVADADDPNVLYPFSDELPVGIATLFDEGVIDRLSASLTVRNPEGVSTEVPYRRGWRFPALPGRRMSSAGTLHGGALIDLYYEPGPGGHAHRDSGREDEVVALTRRLVMDDGTVWYQMKRPGARRAWVPEVNVRID